LDTFARLQRPCVARTVGKRLTAHSSRDCRRLGELGKHGSLISRHFRAGVRLAGVTTDMPLVPTHPDRFWRRRILLDVPGVHEFLPSWCDSRTQADGARRRTMVRRLRQMHSVFCGERFLWHLHCHLSLDAPGRSPQIVGDYGHAHGEGRFLMNFDPASSLP
jgi:hypothetical protein